MDVAIRHMTGHELLLFRIFGGPEIGRSIEDELDRRAVLALSAARLRRRRPEPAPVAARRDALLVA